MFAYSSPSPTYIPFLPVFRSGFPPSKEGVEKAEQEKQPKAEKAERTGIKSGTKSGTGGIV